MRRLLLPAAILAAATTSLTAQMRFEGPSMLDQLTAVQSVERTSEGFVMTPGEGAQTAAVWLPVRQKVADGFRTTFSFRIDRPRITTPLGEVVTDPMGEEGADGFALVIQDQGPTAIGGPGHRIGYEWIRRSLAVEFDTWFNAEPIRDPNSNHVSVHSLGTGPNSCGAEASLGMTTDIPQLADGRVHTAAIEYAGGRLSVSVDGREPLVVPVDLASKLGLKDGTAWIGFTAATAGAWERHEILSWEINATSAASKGAELATAGESAVFNPQVTQNLRLPVLINAGHQVFEARGTLSEVPTNRPVTTAIPLNVENRAIASPLAKVERGEASLAASMTPNPASSTAQLHIGAVKGVVNVNLVDNLGRSLRVWKNDSTDDGPRAIDIDVSDLPSGSYRLLVTSGGRSASLEVRVVR